MQGMQMPKQSSKSKKRKPIAAKPIQTRSVQKPMNLTAASKKFKRAKIQGNTI
jgi:hypothetical protein